MSQLLLISAAGPEVRVALVENSALAELHVERPCERGIVGNIYKGRVVRLLPGMQAAFVDIGIDRAAFLYAGDVVPLDDQDGGDGSTAELTRPDASRIIPIQQSLRQGQDLLVQVAKGPIGGKGARISNQVSLAGRKLVYLPTVNHVGISRRITDEQERQRLREIIDEIRPPEGGFIVRTVAEKLSAEQLRADMEFLQKLWGEVHTRAETADAPALVHQDLDLPLRVVRDLVSTETMRVIADDVETYQRIASFIASFMPRHREALELYQGSDPLFDVHRIGHEIDHALDRKVWLKSGGYLVFDQVEALTAIDVNTGRYVGQRNLEDTITKINLEAVREIANQLRLRNIGGIVIVDFIDMELESNREQVWRALMEALERDRAKTKVLPISELGLVEMTRQRVHQSLMHQLTEPCAYCERRGVVKTPLTMCYDVLREIRRQGRSLPGRSVTVRVHPEVAHLLADTEQDQLAQLEGALSKELRVEARAEFHVEQFEIQVGIGGSGSS